MVDHGEDLQLQEAIARSLEIKSLSKNSSSTSLKAESAAAAAAAEPLKPHEHVGTNKEFVDHDQADGRVDIKGIRKSDMGAPAAGKSHVSQKSSIDNLHDRMKREHKSGANRRVEPHSEKITHPDARSVPHHEVPTRSGSESSGGGGLFSILGKNLPNPFGNNNHKNRSSTSTGGGGGIRSGVARSGDLSSFSDRSSNEQTHTDREMIARARQDILRGAQHYVQPPQPAEILIHSETFIKADRQGNIVAYSSTTRSTGGGHPLLSPSPEHLIAQQILAQGGGGGRQVSHHPMDYDSVPPPAFDEHTEPLNNNKSNSSSHPVSSSSSTATKPKSTTSGISINQALQELLEDKDQYLESLLEFNPGFKFNEKPLEKILLPMNDSNVLECMENYTTELRKQYVDESSKLIEAMDKKTEKDNATCLEYEATIKKLNQDIASQNQTSLEIQEKLAEKSFELHVDQEVIAQDYQLLKENVCKYFNEEEEKELEAEKKERYLKDMIQLLIEKMVKCHPLQDNVQHVDTLFSQSGHQAWIEQVKLQIVHSLYTTSTSSYQSEIQEVKDKHLSEFEARNDMTLKNRKSPYLEECILIAERLAKYAIAENYYFKGGLTLDALDQLYNNKQKVIST